MACQPQDVVTKNHIKYNPSYTLKAKKRNLNLLRFFLSGTMFLGRDKETEKEGFEPVLHNFNTYKILKRKDFPYLVLKQCN